MIDLALERDLDLFFMQHYHPEAEEDVLRILRHPRTVMTFTDSGAHSRFTDAATHTHLLAHWVRDRKEFTLEEAVRMITLAPARLWGFHDRGLLREGMAADINVLDLDRLTVSMPKLVSDLPAGAQRVFQRTEGISATVIGGKVVFRNGEHMGPLPGQLLRNAGSVIH